MQRRGPKSAHLVKPRLILAEAHPDEPTALVLTAGTNVTLTESDGTITASATGGGSGTPWDFDEGSSTTTYAAGTIDFDEGAST
jgi:hypothetical protein